MPARFTVQYWMDDGWYVGRLKEVPGVFSQGETLEELEDNIWDAYELVNADAEESVPEGSQSKLVEIGA